MSTEGQEREASDTLTMGDEPVQEVKRKIEMQVDISDAGPCKKHVKISIPRSEIERQFTSSLDEFGKDAAMPGFRPGRAPRQLVIKRYKKQVAEQVKSALLMTSLGQLEEDYPLEPIAQPNLDIAAIELPDDGPMNYEIDIEVRPEFALPDYKGLTLKRPVRPITEADVDQFLNEQFERHSQVVPKFDAPAAVGDQLTVDLVFYRPDGSVLSEIKERQLRLQPELRYSDGTIPAFGEALTGARPGETRRTEARMGTSVQDPALRGATLAIDVRLHDVKEVRPPELTTAFLNSLGFNSLAELREAVRETLGRRVEAQQRQVLRQQIVDQLLAQTPFDLPADMVAREEASTIQRLVMQLRRQGINDREIRASEASIRANAREAALRSLKELMLLAKIGEAEGIEVADADIEAEIEAMAEQSGESPRRIRARLEKEGMSQSLTAQILEKKVIDFIVASSTVEDDATAGAATAEAVETLDQAAVMAADVPSDEQGGAGTPEAAGQGAEAGASDPAQS